STSFDSLGILSQRWFEGNKLYNIGPDLDFTFKDTGIHRIRLRVTSNEQCWDTLSREVYVKPMPDASFGPLDPFYCVSTSAVNIPVNTPGGIFYGKNVLNNQYIPLVLWEDTISYVLDVNGCVDTAVRYTRVYPVPVVDLGPDTVICKNEYLVFDATNWNATYEWHDGNTGRLYPAKNSGLHWVRVTNICGTAYDEVNVEYQDVDCRVMLPSAFTPNNDGTNDLYKPIIDGVEEMTYYIYNRWGQIVYEGTMNDAGWNGELNGTPVQMDVYLVKVFYKYWIGELKVNGENHEILHLIR
ncbi:MAG: gliding motility-associated C-terminal domain-containing protein, partial [Bacteroidota bacterium]|nr:gliding motility-associated C-terminal domain-containing protein [Bacteroidota bacterium]MDX5429421.1 gliding motility-associated C-terminal domain-containing protein [Bacteroidota bacterium]MDX5468212.1 gliding motility-associated C-terminal domain-containing protein [Bacteroidota bacterium]